MYAMYSPHWGTIKLTNRGHIELGLMYILDQRFHLIKNAGEAKFWDLTITGIDWLIDWSFSF